MKQTKKNRIKESGIDRIFNAMVVLILLFAFLIVLYPLIYIVSASFSTPADVVSGRVWLWPVNFSLVGYEAVFQYKPILTGYANTIYYTVFGTLISLIVTICGAYPLSRRKLYGRKVFNGIFIFATLFSGGLIPFYMIVKNLGMLNTRWAVIAPSALSIYNIIIMRTYMQTSIPEELYEASEIDGCGPFRALLSIILPLSKPIIAVVILYCAVGQWNSYFNAMIFLQDSHLFPLQIHLRDILIMNQYDSSMVIDTASIMAKQGMADVLRYSLIVVSSAPLLAVYPFVQKYFVKGVMIGSLKG